MHHSFHELPASANAEPTRLVVEDLKRLLDGVGEKIGDGVESPTPSGNIRVDTSVDDNLKLLGARGWGHSSPCGGVGSRACP